TGGSRAGIRGSGLRRVADASRAARRERRDRELRGLGGRRGRSRVQWMDLDAVEIARRADAEAREGAVRLACGLRHVEDGRPAPLEDELHLLGVRDARDGPRPEIVEGDAEQPGTGGELEPDVFAPGAGNEVRPVAGHADAG